MQAALKLRELIAPVAAEALGCPVDEARLRRRSGQGQRASRPPTGAPEEITLGELVRLCEARSVDDPTVLHMFHAEMRSVGFDPVSAKAQLSRLRLRHACRRGRGRPETGEVEVLKYAACHDVGRAINPLRVEGQIQGGAMQGLGYALIEEIILDEGKIASSLFADYLVPSSDDMPDVMVDIVESGEGKGPLNARGIGEPPIGTPPRRSPTLSRMPSAFGRRSCRSRPSGCSPSSTRPRAHPCRVLHDPFRAGHGDRPRERLQLSHAPHGGAFFRADVLGGAPPR